MTTTIYIERLIDCNTGNETSLQWYNPITPKYFVNTEVTNKILPTLKTQIYNLITSF
jgi:hypothetical protein